MPKDKPNRWRKKDKRLPKGFVYFPVLDGETKEQSYRRCWGEWLKLRDELNRQAGSPHRVTARTQLTIDPPLEEPLFRLTDNYLLRLFLDAGETDLGTIEGDTPEKILETALARMSASGTPDVPTIQKELDEQYKEKRNRARTGEIAERTAERFREKIDHFVNWIGGSLPLTAITSRRIQDYHNVLAEEMANGKRNRGGAEDQQSAVFHFIRTAYYVSETLPDLPKVVEHRPASLRFTANGAEQKKRRDVANWHDDLDTLANIMADSNPRTRLFLYLGLNCGYQQTDMSELGQDELVGTQIVERKRCKGDRREHVPAVTYTLWPETLALLRRFRAGRNAPHNRKGKPRLLVTEKNTPLLTLTPRADNIRRAYLRILDKANIPRTKRKPIAALRKTSATILEHSVRLTNHQKDYARISSLFLGQAPTDVKGRHYAPGDMKLLQEGLAWLREFYRKHKVIIEEEVCN
jgi:hypothetical protein